MRLLLQILLVTLFTGSIVQWRMPMRVWTPIFAGILILLGVFATPPWWFLFIVTLIYLSGVIVLGVPQVRHTLVTKPLLTRIQKILPPMSETERIALEAGDVWWEAQLFSGRPDWKYLQKLVLPALTAEEKIFLNNEVESLCKMLNDYQIVCVEKGIPPAVWEYLKKNKFFGIVIAKEYGGLGFSALAHSTIVMKIASCSVSVAISMMVPNSLGPGELLTHYGTEEQKKYYLPRLAAGDEIPCFGLTSPEAGSDATAISDLGIVCRENGVLGFRLNFNKRYITLAPVSTLIGVAFKLIDPEGLLGSKIDRGITLCLVPASSEGVEAGHKHSPMGLAFLNGPVRGKDVFLPIDAIIGGEKMIGQGWRMLMECLSIGRSVSLPALMAGVSKLSYRMTGAYALIRKQFNLPLGRFEGIEEALGRIAGLTYTIESARLLTVAGLDLKVKPSLASAITKYHATELGRKVIADALDIHGGRGLQLGPRNYLGLIHQAIPIAITVEGANILTRNLIIFGQGAMRCHPFVQKEMAALLDSDKEKSFAAFDKILLAHIGHVIRNFISVLTLGKTAGHLFSFPFFRNETKKYYRQLSRMSAALALTSDVTLLMLGGALKRRERLSARLGDILSQLYLASSVLKNYQDKSTREDIFSVHWSVQNCLYQIQIAFDELLSNFPNRWVGRLLHFIIFPFGRAYRAPSDKLTHQLAQQAQQISAFRDRLTENCFVSGDPQEATGRIENAFEKILAAEVIERKIADAIKKQQIVYTDNSVEKIRMVLSEKIITVEEAELLEAAEEARQDAIAVDEF